MRVLDEVDFTMPVRFPGARSTSDTTRRLRASHGYDLRTDGAWVYARRDGVEDAYPRDSVVERVRFAQPIVEQATEKACIMCGKPHSRGGATCSQKCAAGLRYQKPNGEQA